MADREMSDGARLRHPEIDGGADAAFPVRLQRAVMGDRAAIATKVKGDAGFAPWPGVPHIFAVVPENSVRSPTRSYAHKTP